jgi:hypothetical protein
MEQIGVVTKGVLVRAAQRDVPIEWRRKAAQHLESVRGTPMAPPGSEAAEIVGDACPIYRPDIDAVAYWEFEVSVHGGPRGGEILTTSAALATQGLADELEGGLREREDAAAADDDGAGPQEQGRGFVIVATGDHDFPIPHWSLQRPPVSRQLEREAGSGRIARVWKLDALAYVAEDERGEIVARCGQTPVPVEAAGGEGGQRAGQMGSLVATPDRSGADGDGKTTRHSVRRSGPKEPQVRLADPREWAQLKRRYADAFGPALAELRRRARGPWEVDEHARRHGEGVLVGEPFSIGLLHREAAVEVTGEGAALVDLQLEEKAGRGPRVRGKARPSPRGREVEFAVHIRYPGGEAETLRYFLVSRDTPSNMRGPKVPGGERP